MIPGGVVDKKYCSTNYHDTALATVIPDLELCQIVLLRGNVTTKIVIKA